VVRLLVILRHLLPLVASFLRDRKRWLIAGAPFPRDAAFHQRRAYRLLAAITRLGPSFVKLGQVFAGRADLMPEPYAKTLGALTDRVPPAPFAAIRETVEAELGRKLEEVFEAFPDEPIAAGSLGQVYRARYQGRDVAVKVLRPGVRELVARDVRIARALMTRVERRWPNVHTRGVLTVVEEFALRVNDEMDFRLEAVNLRTVQANFLGNTRIRIPDVVEPLSGERVLVMEYLAGTKIDQLEPGRAYGPIRTTTVVERLIELYAQMMYIDGFYHADPHPGNLLVADDGTLILLDFGVVLRVTRERRRQLVETIFASIRKDYGGLVQGFYDMGIVAPGAGRQQLEELVGVLMGLASQPVTARERAEMLSQRVMDELYNWPIQLPSDLVYFARTATLIEGIGIRYDPRFNPVDAARPVMLRMRPRLMAALQDGGPPDLLDWPTMLGYLAGRATRWISGFLAGFRTAERTAGTEPRPVPALPAGSA
jgi:predicted unusual protein kinase regulating ubiquinone biosynthesis (AarF/ABC1/UbiB family)